MRYLSKGTLFVVLLIVVSGVEGISRVHLQREYENLSFSHRALNTSHQSLVSEHNNLKSIYISLNQSHVSLQNQYAGLEEDYRSLQNAYSGLRREHEIAKALSIGSSLESFYDLLRTEEGPQLWWSQQKEVDFCARLAIHDLGRSCWLSLENEYREVLGVYSYEAARKRLDRIIALIGNNPSDSPTERIRKILAFLSDHLSYEAEVANVYHAPVETLGFKSGDCDDYSTLAATLFEAAGIDAAVGFFKNEKKESHAMVLVHLESLGSYKYLYYPDLTGKGLKSGKWIIIEPQFAIERQDDPVIKQWSLVVAAPLD